MSQQIKIEEILTILNPLAPIMQDNNVWEIMIDGFEQITVEKDGHLQEVASPFNSAEQFRQMIDALFALYDQRLDQNNPIGYLNLPNHSRCMAIIPPNAVDAPHFVLRQVVNKRPSWDDVIGWGSIPKTGYELIVDAVNAKRNILVVGGTGSGKTTVTGLIVEKFPANERTIIVEEEYEILTTHPRLVRLEAGGPGGISIDEILTAATRMRPDRLVFGNFSGPIAATVLQHFGMGYDGSLSQIHGTSVMDALRRLESYCLMANLGLGLSEIRQLIASGIQLIVHMQNLGENGRKVVDIVELSGVEDHRFILQPLMRFNPETNKSEFTLVKPSWQRS